jgi:hypothetical protein
MKILARSARVGLAAVAVCVCSLRPALADVDSARQQYQSSLAEVKTARQNYIDTRRKNPEDGDIKTLTLITTEGQTYLLKSMNAMSTYLSFIRAYVESLEDLPETTREGAYQLIDADQTWFTDKKALVAALNALKMNDLQTHAEEINRQWRLTTRHTHQVLASILIYRMEARVARLTELLAQLEQRFEAEKPELNDLNRRFLERSLARIGDEVDDINRHIAGAKESFAEKTASDDLDKEAFDDTFDHLRSVEEDLSAGLTLARAIVQPVSGAAQ